MLAGLQGSNCQFFGPFLPKLKRHFVSTSRLDWYGMCSRLRPADSRHYASWHNRETGSWTPSCLLPSLLLDKNSGKKTTYFYVKCFESAIISIRERACQIFLSSLCLRWRKTERYCSNSQKLNLICRIGCNPYTMMVKFDANIVNGTEVLSNLWGYEVCIQFSSSV
jgi:hypothetical protein